MGLNWENITASGIPICDHGLNTSFSYMTFQFVTLDTFAYHSPDMVQKTQVSSRRRAREDLIRDDFSRAVVFLALSIIEPHNAAASQIRDMSPDQVVAVIRNTLENELQSLYCQSKTTISSIGVIRHVLTQIGGPQNAAQLDLIAPDCCETRISAVFSSLSLPNEWTNRFTPQAWRSLQSLNNEINSLCPSLSQPHNAERIFTVWNYVMHKSVPGLPKLIEPAANAIFGRAAGTLMRSSCPPPQIVLDLVTMVCVQRLAPHNESCSRFSLMTGLHNIFKTGSRENMLPVLNRLLASLYRVIGADDFSHRNQGLAGFILKVGFPKSVLEFDEGHADHYWAYRLADGLSHEAAFDKVCWRAGSYPVSLPALQLSKRPNDTAVEIKVEREEDVPQASDDIMQNLSDHNSEESFDSAVIIDNRLCSTTVLKWAFCSGWYYLTTIIIAI
ncbi:hypothetical protein F66182_4982 [Fusarium sp. NRRL 66182]|nr:hypothetical protein F66182_4982 [Fusarium sp. NRRL 66182]